MEVPLLPREHLAISRDIFCCHKCVCMWVLLASTEESSGMLLNYSSIAILHIHRLLPWAPNVSSAEVEKYCFKCKGNTLVYHIFQSAIDKILRWIHLLLFQWQSFLILLCITEYSTYSFISKTKLFNLKIRSIGINLKVWDRHLNHSEEVHLISPVTMFVGFLEIASWLTPSSPSAIW